MRCVILLALPKKKHKIVILYITVANINPWYYTKRDNIHLVALIFEKDVKKFSFNTILERVITDIKILETKVWK